MAKFNYDETPSEMVTLVFKEYRKFELHIGNEVYHFSGNEPVKVPRSVLAHPDFHDDVKQLFVVKE
jgi:hypothetical protein